MSDKHKFDKVEYEVRKSKEIQDKKEKDDSKQEVKKDDLKGLQRRIERIERILDI